MASYDNAKFYWLQLKEDFFDEDVIDWLEEQPNGKEYSLFYLKLCLKSLRTNGIMIRRVGDMLVPYDAKKLGELTKTNPDTALIAMNLLVKIGLIKQLEGGELYMTQVENMIGSQSKGAFKKQQQRIATKTPQLIEGGQMSTKCPPDIEIDIDIDKEKEIEIDKEIETKQASKKASKESSYDEIISQSIVNESVKETLREFIKMRKLIKKPLTDFALKKLITKLVKLSPVPSKQVEILEQSILNNWQDIYELKEDKGQKKQVSSTSSEFESVADKIRQQNTNEINNVDYGKLDF